MLALQSEPIYYIGGLLSPDMGIGLKINYICFPADVVWLVHGTISLCFGSTSRR